MIKIVYNNDMERVGVLERRSLAGRLAWLFAAVSILMVILSLGIAALGIISTGEYRQILSHQTLTPFVTIIFAGIGSLVASRRPRNPIGWIFAAVGLMYALVALAAAISNYLPASPLHELAYWLGSWLWIPAVFLPMTFVILLFPEGKLPSGRWAIVSWSAAMGIAFITFVVMFYPGPLESFGLLQNPYGIPSMAPLLPLLLNIASVLIALGLIGSLANFFIRFHRSTGSVRDQMKWMVYALGVSLAAAIANGIGSAIWPGSALMTEISIFMADVVVLAIAVAAMIAILRHRLFDIDLIINRTLVYTALTIGVITLYGLVVGSLGVMFQASGHLAISLLATGLAAILIQPMRDWLQRTINRLMYGERDDPYAVLSGLNRQLQASLSPEETLPAVVRIVAQALKLPYVAISLKQNDTFETAARYGTESGETLQLPLLYQGEEVGLLSLAGRSPNETFSRAEKRLLEDIARHIGVTAHTVKLTQDLRSLARDLQHSRERIISAREEERRRLRRDLHDGLGPVTASQGLKLAALQQYSQRDPQAVEKLLNQLITQNEGIVTEIRRLVYGLRPPALDEVGLVDAIRDQVAAASGEPGIHLPLDVRVEEPLEPLPTLPAAVEVAAYRIAMEAVTNVYRHANAHSCTIRFSSAGAGLADTGRAGGYPFPEKMLILEICDDGSGVPELHKSGVGLSSMRERAEEVGGACVVESIPGGGTRVLAQFPVE
jgi:signal transduction histidine kinase